VADSNSNGAPGNLFQQYELYVKSLEKVDDLRARASKLLVILNSAILSAFAYGLFELVKPGNGNWKDSWPVGVIIGLMGVALSLVWVKMICDYKKLYKFKSCVVKSLEKKMTERVFTQQRVYTQEWEAASNESFSISNWEKCLAYSFMGLYVPILLGGIVILIARLVCCSSLC